MTNDEVLFEVDDKGVALLTLNRPDQLNALTTRMLDNTLPDLFRRVNEDDDIKVLIITGAGRGFCSGADVQERLQGIQSGKLQLGFRYYSERVTQFTMGLADQGKPIIAAVNGQAAGVGYSLALLADFRIATPSAKFCAVFARRGMVPDGGMTRSLQMAVGYSKALELMMTTDNIDAQEAHRIGLVNKIVESDQLLDEAREMSGKLLQQAPLSLAFIKRAAQHAWSCNHASAIEFESWGQAICRHSEDIKEGVNSFIEKRPAQFKGR